MKRAILTLLTIIPLSVIFGQQEYEPGVIIIRVKQPDVVSFSDGKVSNGSPQLEEVFNRYKATTIRKLSHVSEETDGCYLIRFPVDYNVNTIRVALADCPDIEHVNLAYYGILCGTPNDTYWNSQWALKKILMELSWDIVKPDTTILIGILDTGIDLSHENLEDNIWKNPNEIPDNYEDDDENGLVDDMYGWDWVSGDNDPQDGGIYKRYHGTRVAGIISAKTYNNQGVAGIAGGWRDECRISFCDLGW